MDSNLSSDYFSEAELPYRAGKRGQQGAQSLEQRTKQSRFMLWTVGSFVIITSFLYGISAGLRGDRSLAFATLGDNFWNTLFETQPEFDRLQLPRGVVATSMGDDVMINDRAAEVASFVTSRRPDQVVEEMKRLWEQQGAKVLSHASTQRGFAIAINFSTHERQRLSIWTVPSSAREVLSGGYAVQGIITLADFSERTTPIGSGSEGEVPEIPILPGGRGGAVFSSQDTGGRSWSGVYTVPGTLEEVLDSYRYELEGEGWKYDFRDLPTGTSLRESAGSLRMVRGNEEVILLASPRSLGKETDTVGKGGTGEVVLSVNRGPRNEITSLSADSES